MFDQYTRNTSGKSIVEFDSFHNAELHDFSNAHVSFDFWPHQLNRCFKHVGCQGSFVGQSDKHLFGQAEDEPCLSWESKDSTLS
jgi:hypothetical protein